MFDDVSFQNHFAYYGTSLWSFTRTSMIFQILMSCCFLAIVCHTIITMWFRVYMFANVSISTLVCCCMWTFFVIFWNSMYFWILIQVHFQVCIQLSLWNSYDQMLRKNLQKFISLISFMALTISLANINSKILKI